MPLREPRRAEKIPCGAPPAVRAGSLMPSLRLAFTADLHRLSRLENVDLIGEVPYGQVPKWLSRFDVTILPFRRNALTEATNPVKLYEILAAGKPLVSVPLPEMVRLSVGLESVDDILWDLDQALEKSQR